MTVYLSNRSDTILLVDKRFVVYDNPARGRLYRCEAQDKSIAFIYEIFLDSAFSEIGIL